jgi:hypothetical protein
MMTHRMTFGFGAILIATLLGTGPRAAAQEGGLELSGTIESGLSLVAGDGLAFEDPRWSDGSLDLGFIAEARPAEGLRVYAELGFDEALPAASPTSLDALSVLASPSIRIVEAWASLQDAPIPGTELRVGRQRIAWGPAESVGVVDAFDVPDFSTLDDFGAKLASDAVRFRYFGNRFGIDLAWSPFWRPAPLPAEIPASMMPATSIPGMTVTSTPTLDSPGADPWDASTFGCRITWEPELWTLGASYVYGRSPTPQPYSVVVTPTGPTTADADSSLEWPRRHQVSLDLAGELFGIGVWAEGALVIPDRDYVLDLSALGYGSTTTEDDPYGRWLLGLDYTFTNDLYVNFQYVRGMAWENLPDTQNDYAVLALQREVSGGKLLLGPIALIVEVDGLAEVISGDRAWEDSVGAAISPSISYRPYDGVELTAALAWLLGSETTTLGAMADTSRLVFGTKISF